MRRKNPARPCFRVPLTMSEAEKREEQEKKNKFYRRLFRVPSDETLLAGESSVCVDVREGWGGGCVCVCVCV
jgi:hypothetical protein